jgi:WD40 repeat protein
VIGFNGKVANGLHYTPDGGYIVYPLGSVVVIKNLRTDKEAFLEGHTREVSCLAVSQDGSKVASGQVNITGVKADVIVWDLVAAKAKLDANDGDTVWLQGKLDLYELYAANVLGHVSSRLAAVGQGGDLLKRMTVEALAG